MNLPQMKQSGGEAGGSIQTSLKAQRSLRVCLSDVFLADSPGICRAVAPFQSVPTQTA